MSRFKNLPLLGLSLLGVVALPLAGCASQPAPRAESARLGCEQLGASAQAEDLVPGKVRSVSRVTETEFVARAVQPTRTVGADLYVRAEPGMSAEYLERVLSCQASAKATAAGGDVLHPSSGSVALSVRSASGGYVVRAVGSTPEAGREIWKHAESLTHAGVAVEQVASLDSVFESSPAQNY